MQDQDTIAAALGSLGDANWEWQTGRLLAKDPQNIRAAIVRRLRSLQTLENIRSGILSANTDLQFHFSKNVEPVYRELIALRLKDNPQSQVKQQQVETFQKADAQNDIAPISPEV